MTTHATLKATASGRITTSNASGARFVQRKCACGSSKLGVGDDCTECQSKRIQRKLAIGSTNDPLEAEADRVAEQTMARPALAPGVSHAPPRIQRLSTAASGGGGVAAKSLGAGGAFDAPASVESALATSGRPLDAPLRADMERRFGSDFAQVRIHDGAEGAVSARAIGANAYTVGTDIVFAPGHFAPGTGDGRRLLAHELTHVLQQGGGREVAQRDTATEATVTVVSITVLEGAVGERAAIARTSDGQSIRLQVDANSLVAGEYESASRIVESDPHGYTEVEVYVGKMDQKRFVYQLPPGMTMRPGYDIVVRRNLRREVRSLSPETQRLLIDESRPSGADASLERTIAVGHKIEAAGLSEDELLLLRHREPKGATEDVLDSYLEQREDERAIAEGAREQLTKHGARLAALDAFPYRDQLPPLGALKNQFGGALDVLEGWLREDSDFDGVTDLRNTLNEFAAAFNEEVYGLAMAFLSGLEAGLLRMQDRYIGVPLESRKPSVLLGNRLRELRKNSKVAAALAAHRAASGDEREAQARRVDEAVAEADGPGLDGGASVGLLEAKSDREAQNQLGDVITQGLSTVRKMRASLDPRKPATLYWDRIVAAQKARMGIEQGTWMNYVVDEVVRVGSRGASSFWDRAKTVLEVVMMFVPGGQLGLAIRTVLAVGELDKSFNAHAVANAAYETGMSSQKPSKKDLFIETAFTVGGIALDAGFTRVVPKTAPARAAKQTAGEADDAVRAADDLAGAAKPVKGAVDGDVAKAAAREIDEKELKVIGATTDGGLNPATRSLLNSKPLLRRALSESDLAARALKKCNSPCYPPNATPEQVRVLEKHLEKLKAGGPYHEPNLREFLYENRDDLDRAIGDVLGSKTSRQLDQALRERKISQYPVGPRLPPKEDPRVRGAMVERSHDTGVLHGRAYATGELGLKGFGFKNPFEKVGKYGQGFDDIMVVGGDLKTGTIYIVEYKGGRAALDAGQMELDWVVTNIRRLFREGDQAAQDLARDLSKALREGRLKGVALSTPMDGNIADTTRELGNWVYDAKKSASRLSF